MGGCNQKGWTCKGQIIKAKNPENFANKSLSLGEMDGEFDIQTTAW